MISTRRLRGRPRFAVARWYIPVPLLSRQEYLPIGPEDDSPASAVFSVLLPCATHTQAELQLRSTQLQAEEEVRDAYSRYQAAVQRLELYRGGMLKDADRVLEARLYAYQRGGATLLEVLDAQRTSAEVYLAYS